MILIIKTFSITKFGIITFSMTISLGKFSITISSIIALSMTIKQHYTQQNSLSALRTIMPSVFLCHK
jgi:hypothetical protein